MYVGEFWNKKSVARRRPLSPFLGVKATELNNNRTRNEGETKVEGARHRNTFQKVSLTMETLWSWLHLPGVTVLHRWETPFPSWTITEIGSTRFRTNDANRVLFRWMKVATRSRARHARQPLANWAQHFAGTYNRPRILFITPFLRIPPLAMCVLCFVYVPCTSCRPYFCTQTFCYWKKDKYEIEAFL